MSLWTANTIKSKFGFTSSTHSFVLCLTQGLITGDNVSQRCRFVNIKRIAINSWRNKFSIWVTLKPTQEELGSVRKAKELLNVFLLLAQTSNLPKTISLNALSFCHQYLMLKENIFLAQSENKVIKGRFSYTLNKGKIIWINRNIASVCISTGRNLHLNKSLENQVFKVTVHKVLKFSRTVNYKKNDTKKYLERLKISQTFLQTFQLRHCSLLLNYN